MSLHLALDSDLLDYNDNWKNSNIVHNYGTYKFYIFCYLFLMSNLFKWRKKHDQASA